MSNVPELTKLTDLPKTLLLFYVFISACCYLAYKNAHISCIHFDAFGYIYETTVPSQCCYCFFLRDKIMFFLIFYVFICLHWVFVAAEEIFHLHCGMWALQLQHVGPQLLCVASSSLTRIPTWAPKIGSAESQPLNHQRSPSAIIFLFLIYFSFLISFFLLIGG